MLIWYSLLLCLIYSEVNGSSHRSCYSSYNKDILNVSPIEGKWEKNQFYTSTGVFASNKNISQWLDDACPAQSLIYNCRNRDLMENGHGYQAYSQRFIPTNCRLKEFDPIKFLSMLKNRRLGIAGDSVSSQFSIMIICSLHQVIPNIQYQLQWHDLRHVYHACSLKTGNHCHLDAASVYYPAFNATILYIPEFIGHYRRVTLKEYYQAGLLRSNQDILLLNSGLHIHDPNFLLQLTQNYVQEYQSIPKNQQPIFIWRETSPQHFDSEAYGSYSGYFYQEIFMKPSTCIPYSNLKKAYLQDFRNRIPDKIFQPAHIPIMRIHNISSNSYDQHIFLQYYHGKNATVDCTHFCETASVFYLWREVLFNILPIIIHARPYKS